MGDDADGGAQAVLGQVADILPVDQDAPAGDVVETEQEACQGRLARPAVADDGQCLTGLDPEIHISK
jgi:hypothetical protein